MSKDFRGAEAYEPSAKWKNGKKADFCATHDTPETLLHILLHENLCN